jgi:GNAT superfamily N-acetyltransferase
MNPGCYRRVVDELVLATVEHENMIETMVASARGAPGALVRRADGVAMFATGLPIELFNQVIVEYGNAAPATVAAAIAANVATMRERGETFLVSLRRGTDDAYLPLMVELGLTVPPGAAAMPGMALHPIRTAGDLPGATLVPDGHEIRLVCDVAGMDDHLRTCALGFGMPEGILRSFISADLWREPGRAVYVGYVAGEPVTTALGVRTGNTIGVYNIATVRSARRRGYGAAMTLRVAADGAAAGCDVAILQASEMGRPIYERLGYRTVVEYDWYLDSAGSPP